MRLCLSFLGEPPKMPKTPRLGGVGVCVGSGGGAMALN